jgi:hypothetical protein
MSYTDLMDARDIIEVALLKVYEEQGFTPAWHTLSHAESHISGQAREALRGIAWKVERPER